MEGAQDIGEHKGYVLGQGFWEHGGSSGECVVSTDCDARYGTIGKDENGSDGVEVILDLGRNPLVEFILLYSPFFGCFDDPLLERLYFTRNTVKNDASEISL